MDCVCLVYDFVCDRHGKPDRTDIGSRQSAGGVDCLGGDSRRIDYQDLWQHLCSLSAWYEPGGFAAPMGANYPIPHGTVCALLLPPVFQANARALRETSKDHPYLCRYEQLGRWLAEDAQLTGELAIEAGLEKLRGLVEELRIAPLREFGVKQEDFAELVLLAQRASSMKYNPIELSAEALTGILAAAW